LPQLWLRGSWAHLALAVGFTALANLLAASAVVWHEWLPLRVRWITLATLGLIWLLAWIEGRADWRQMLAELSGGEPTPPVDVTAQCDEWFRTAQQAYLAGDWVSAEQTLLKLLKQDSRDAEARLLLATLWRHEGRRSDAADQLDRLDLVETAAPWRYEITRERELVCANCVETLPDDSAAPLGRPMTNETSNQKLAA